MQPDTILGRQKAGAWHQEARSVAQKGFVLRILYMLFALCFVAPASAATYSTVIHFDATKTSHHCVLPGIFDEDEACGPFQELGLGMTYRGSVTITDASLETYSAGTVSCEIEGLDCSPGLVWMSLTETSLSFGTIIPEPELHQFSFDFAEGAGRYFTADEGAPFFSILFDLTNVTQVPLPASSLFLMLPLLILALRSALRRATDPVLPTRTRAGS